MLAKMSPYLMASFDKLFPELPLTDDDKFLISLNSIFSSVANKTGYMNQPRHYTFDQRLKFDTVNFVLPEKSSTLEEIVSSRAEYLINTGRPLKVFWSGGIDSTLVVASLLATIKNLDQIQIYHTCESVRENPKFYDYILNHNVKPVMWSDAWEKEFAQDDLIITGTSADEITGSLDRSFFDRFNKHLNMPWERFFNAIMNTSFVDQCSFLFSKSHSPIKTVFDARWWFYFYIRHTHFARRDWDLNIENNFSSNVIQFFNTPEFDLWSIDNKDSLIGNEYRDYKMSFKVATSKFWNDQNYITNKEKGNSIYGPLWACKKIAKFDQHYTFIYKENDNYITYRSTQFPFINRTEILQKCLNI
jgi:hypothetical protein